MEKFALRGAVVLGVIAFTIQLVELPRPFAGLDSWRDAHTFGVARNFLEEGFNLLRPQVDLRGTGNGELPAEFPFYPAVAAALMAVFGVAPPVARVAALLLSLVGLWGAVRVGRALGGGSSRAGLFAGVLYLSNTVISKQATAIMPDGASNTLALLAAVCIVAPPRWLASRAWLAVTGATAFVTLATLVKPSGLAVVGLLVAWWSLRLRELVWRERLWRAVKIAVPTAVVPLVAFSLWVRHTMKFEYLVYEGGGAITHHFYRSSDLILSELTWENFAHALKKPIFHGLGVAGLGGIALVTFLLWRRRKTLVAAGEQTAQATDLAPTLVGLALWAAACFAYLLLAGNVQTRQTYYATPIALPMVLLAAQALARVPPVAAVALLVVHLGFSVHFHWRTILRTMPEWEAAKLEPIADRFSTRADLFIAKGVRADFMPLGRLGRRGIVLQRRDEIVAAAPSYRYLHLRSTDQNEIAFFTQRFGRPLLVRGDDVFFDLRTPVASPE